MSAAKDFWIKFEPASYIRDTRMLTLTTRAVWMDLLCLMHDSPRAGYLLTAAGNLMPPEQLARFVGCSLDDISGALTELLASGVASRDDQQVVFSRRMVREAKQRVVDRKNGRTGGNPLLIGGGGVNPPDKPPDKPHLTLTIDSDSHDTLGEEAGEGPPPSVEEIYRAYPRKKGRGAALRAIETALRKIGGRGVTCPGPWLLERVEAYARERSSVVAADPSAERFTPHPATWFNRESYDDDAEAPPTSVGGPKRPRMSPPGGFEGKTYNPG